MNSRALALIAGAVLSCAGCVTETKTVPMSEEKFAKLKDVKPADHANREIKPETIVAMGQMHEGIASDPKTPPLQQSAHRDEARIAYNRALEKDPKCVEAYLALANSYAKVEDYDHATEALQKGMKQLPNSAELCYEQSNIYCKTRDLRNASEYLGKAHKLAPTNHLYAAQYGFCLARLGQPDEAVRVMAEVMSKADANFQVARMMEHMKQPEQCRLYLTRAIQERPTHEAALTMMAQLDNPHSAPVATLTIEAGADGAVRPATWNSPAIQP